MPYQIISSDFEAPKLSRASCSEALLHILPSLAISGDEERDRDRDRKRERATEVTSERQSYIGSNKGQVLNG